MEKKKILIIAECAVMLGLATALSFVKLYRLPWGGSVTVVSMLPIMLLSIRRGVKIGLPVAFIYSLLQLAFSLSELLSYSFSAITLTSCFIYDFILPFSAIGLAGLFRKKSIEGWMVGIEMSLILRFAFHVYNGVVVYKIWAWDGWDPLPYSVAYNSAYMFPELVITSIAAYLLFRAPYVRNLFTVTEAEKKI